MYVRFSSAFPILSAVIICSAGEKVHHAERFADYADIRGILLSAMIARRRWIIFRRYV
jgi:hypothetical protein